MLMRDQLDRAGLTIRQLRELLTPQLLDGRKAPSVTTLSNRFAGVGLINEGWLVDAVLHVCAPADEVDALKGRVRDLLAKRRAREQGGARSEEIVLAPQVPDLRRQLDEEREKLRRSQVVTAMLMGMLARGAGNAASGLPGRHSDTGQLVHRIDGLEKEVRLLRLRLTAERAEPSPMREPAVAAVPPTPKAHPGGDGGAGLSTVARTLQSLDPDGSRLVSCIRRTFDQVLDGPRTGRFRLDQLSRSERMRLPLQMETEVEREFGFASNRSLSVGHGADFYVEGVPVDFRFRVGRIGRVRSFGPDPVLLVHADDGRGLWSAGLWCDPQAGGAALLGRELQDTMHWLFRDAPLPGNVLLQLPADDLQAIFAPGSAHGRIVELMRRAPGRLVSRSALKTVGMTSDVDRRIRRVRARLADDGIVILTWFDRDLAAQLGLPQPSPREYVSARLARVAPGRTDVPTAELEGERWTVAGQDDPVESVPYLR
ncbi:NaeI family type II restriction endonuclease [Streptomyces catenulae]|uniref:NaeI family type II restriction endonuclease n=1 Tax=Streptomyces catenulae TaxID=66875 RepID=A0ABV2YYM2_9ACTN|nr:NaeI family type II restriction endonuclease [Streptomyces catenulae]